MVTIAAVARMISAHAGIAEHTGVGGGPIELADLRGLTANERRALRGIAEKVVRQKEI